MESMPGREAIFGECWNYKSCLRILIWPTELPFFLVRKHSLLTKVPIFDTHPPYQKSRNGDTLGPHKLSEYVWSMVIEVCETHEQIY